MKLRNTFVNIIIVGSIFFISTLSFGGIISLQDNGLDNFWKVQKINLSFISASYADDGEREHDDRDEREERYEKKYKHEDEDEDEDDDDFYENTHYNKAIVTSPVPYVVQEEQIIAPVAVPEILPIIEVEKKEIVLSQGEKNEIEIRFVKLTSSLNKKYHSDGLKLKIYKKINILLDEKIATLEYIKKNIKNQELIGKYEKKILLFSELNHLTQEKILVYIDVIDVEDKLLTAEKIATQKTVDTTVADAAAKKAADVAAAKLAAQKVIADQIASAARQKAAAEAERLAAQKAAEVAAAKLAAQRAADAAAAKVAAQKAAAVAAAKLAAQQAAAAKVNTNTRAS